VKQGTNDAEADDLGSQVRPIDTESPADHFELPATACVR
jgi:hypothetical protein